MKFRPVVLFAGLGTDEPAATKLACRYDLRECLAFVVRPSSDIADETLPQNAFSR